MDNIKLLQRLIDNNAIAFLKANEKNYDTQLDSFFKINKYVCCIDLS